MQATPKLAAYPLITMDPFLSVWSYTEKPALQEAQHWCGQIKRLTLGVTVDGVAFGMMFPGEPENAHQANECIDVANFFKAARIYAYAILALCA